MQTLIVVGFVGLVAYAAACCWWPWCTTGLTPHDTVATALIDAVVALSIIVVGSPYVRQTGRRS